MLRDGSTRRFTQVIGTQAERDPRRVLESHMLVNFHRAADTARQVRTSSKARGRRAPGMQAAFIDIGLEKTAFSTSPTW
jgi:hypothetical protein